MRNAFPAFDLNLVRSPLPAEGVLRDTGYAAFVELSDRLGTDWTKWTLGALQTIKINHPLADRASEQDKTNVGPAPIGGHVQTLNKASSDDALSVSVGPSFRLVIDVGEWDNSVAVNMPGQSGDPSSAHYADQFEFWRTGQYIPLISSRHAVEESCRSRIVLTPIA